MNTVIVEQDTVYRNLLSTNLTEQGIVIVPEDIPVTEISCLYRKYFPNLFVLGIGDNFQQSIESIEYLMYEYPFAKIIVTANEIEDYHVKEIIRVGVKGIVLKSSGFDSLLHAMQTVDNGFNFFDPFVTNIVIQEFFKLRTLDDFTTSKRKVRDPRNILTKREYEILENLVLGSNNKKIAESLTISEKTVQNHMSNIFVKLKVNDRTQAVILAIKEGWVAI
ncbi:response regulator transcription factor [Psychrobacillus sp. FSL K6-4615]|uniref:response regulator transcription factor n=1 Tax=Psychrobacillus sp. FSL K6-4615 TaxID=2921551 RepID=UPI0030F4FEA5